MFAEKHYPEMMLPEELDAYLASGWYRMGQTIFTTHFLCFGDQFYSAIWIRLDLKDYHFRKSLRKLIRKNLDQYTVSFHRASISPEKERLYRRYKGTFPGILAPTLRDSLLDGEDYNIYDTYEVRVKDNKRLIALSYMDRGQNSLASITGIYDPEYRKNSLGFFTMLMEIAFCLDHGIEYYYPGYVVPGYTRFNYKLRIGNTDYFNLRTNQWEPYESLEKEAIPIEKMRKKLSELFLVLNEANIAAKIYYYPLFEANLFGFWKAPYFDFPLFISLSLPYSDHYLMVVYDVTQAAYLIVRCSNFDDLQFYFNESYVNSFDQNRFFMELIVLDQVLHACSTKEEAFTLILQKLGSSNAH